MIVAKDNHGAHGDHGEFNPVDFPVIPVCPVVKWFYFLLKTKRI